MRHSKGAPYEAPETYILEVSYEGVICLSGDTDTNATRQDYGDPIFYEF